MSDGPFLTELRFLSPSVDGALYTFGERDSGKLGLGTEQLPGHRVPQPVKSIKEPVTQVSCGGGHTVVLTGDHAVKRQLRRHGLIFSERLVRVSSRRRRLHLRPGPVRTARPRDLYLRVSAAASGGALQEGAGRSGGLRGESHGCHHRYSTINPHTQQVCSTLSLQLCVCADGGLLYTFGDGRHGKLGLGEENFTNQFKPTLCSRFLKYNVQQVRHNQTNIGFNLFNVCFF